ncbi:putative uncharacterized transcriptional regulatory protein [Clavispora lusitaniae]|uniref:Uncharacterized transcriptional regulatory protein n=1 Tax=Clavispora lusitaniae TaxID=36911 RepID=A0ACD0WEC7_CLALS|nr:putative uncharacterized transcriptional regulatory protein [Clavispora lusitaniae]QFZ31106.1 putative uncharacterized transcriptional regulatory protein [Clavispora lusitaniae]QFZ36774.1 putative uncharacterized transcriptional regulatory protein [Clavispora lusitaniae]QFZ42458.1 putative uncharacterized transcriptional regulatory protein [Clavispora lusitaniae]QFZ48134.1 putative uncharacterized transcriptional regulatory protein [Clavispora lusitaniae]
MQAHIYEHQLPCQFLSPSPRSPDLVSGVSSASLESMFFFFHPRFFAFSGTISTHNRKKCDQTKPICGGCSARKLECRWPENRSGYSRIRFVSNIVAEQTETPKESLALTKMQNSPQLPDQHTNLSPLLREYFEQFISDPEEFHLSPEFAGLARSPTLPLSYALSDAENNHFEYFCTLVAPKMAIVPKNINPFFHTCLQLAIRDPAVLQCLVGWGSIFRDRLSKSWTLASAPCTRNSPFVQESLAILATRDVTDPQSFISSLFCFAILMCIEISIGDTDAWSRYLSRSYDLLNQMGGFKVLANYSMEGKILAQNFAYFDILASQSNENGTFYPVDQYYELFHMRDTESLDPMQGCVRPLVLILGEVINLINTSKSFITADVTEANMHEFNEVLQKAETLEEKVNNASVDPSDYQILAKHDNIENHFTMFALYQMIIRLYIKQSLKRLPPIVPEIQVLLRQALNCLEELIETPLSVCLSFPLLVAGISSVGESDRDWVLEKIGIIVDKYQFDNTKKVEVVLRQVWKENRNGTCCVDWFRITKSFGWRFNAGI